MKTTTFSSAAAVLFPMCTLLCTSCQPTNIAEYGKDLDSFWRGVFRLSPDDGAYRWMGYPVDNYGALTAYDPQSGKDFTDKDFICDTWYCVGVPDDQVPKGTSQEDVLKRLRVNGFVAEGSGASITLNETKKRDLAFSLLLPSLLKALNVDASLDLKKSVTITITLGTAYKRRVRRDEYQKFIEEKTTNKTLKEAFTNGRLSYVAADIVVTDVEATIKINNSTDSNVKLTLDKMVGTVLSPNSSFNFTGSSSADGVYTFKIHNPVILAVQTRHQPSAGVLAGDNPGQIEAGFPLKSFLTLPPTERKQ